ncbi:MAG: hypothetical protein H6558_04295 [Lewinellaceae bacterium]|nr:hypothetical protein [Lewinellaceae bacterium]MCB9291252.1 hypothetical protein [Lewinellaceae bacterium]
MGKPNDTQDYDKLLRSLYRAIIFLSSFIVVLATGLIYYGLMGNPFSQSREATAAAVKREMPVADLPSADERIADGIHLATGLRVAEGFEVVRATCTGCHSGKLIAQNRATRDGWQEMIRWMQRTQGLWELGKNEADILDYLAANYAPVEIGRRANLDVEAIEWYILGE